MLREANKDSKSILLRGIWILNLVFLAQVFRRPLVLTSADSSQTSSWNTEEFQDLWPQLTLVLDDRTTGASWNPQCHFSSAVIIYLSEKFGILYSDCALEYITVILRQKCICSHQRAHGTQEER